MCAARQKTKQEQPPDRRAMCAILSCHLNRLLVSVRCLHISGVVQSRVISSPFLSRSGAPRVEAVPLMPDQEYRWLADEHGGRRTMREVDPLPGRYGPRADE